MTYSKKDIDHKLKEYKSLSRIKRQLEFELSLPLTDIADSDESCVNHGSQRHELVKLLMPVATELRRMEYYIELLPREVGMILKALYFEGLTYRDTAAMFMIDVKSVTNRRNQGLSELAVMYSRLPDGSHKNPT